MSNPSSSSGTGALSGTARHAKASEAGSSVNLPHSRYGLHLCWSEGKKDVDLDLQALAVDDMGHVVDAVYYNRLETSEKAFSHTGNWAQGRKNAREETVWLNFNRLKKSVRLVVVAVACPGGGYLSYAQEAKVHLLERLEGQIKETYTLATRGGVQAFLVIARSQGAGSWMATKAMDNGLQGAHFVDILEPTIGKLIRRSIKGAARRTQMMLRIGRGGLQDLPQPHKAKQILFGIGWDMRQAKTDLDVSAVLFGDVGQKLGAVFYNNKEAFGLCHQGDNETDGAEEEEEVIVLDLNQVPASVYQIFFIVNVYTKALTLEPLRSVYCRLSTDTGDELLRCEYNPEAAHGSGLIIARIYRNEKAKRWSFQALNSFCEGGRWMDRSCLKEMQRLFYTEPEALLENEKSAAAEPEQPRSVASAGKVTGTGTDVASTKDSGNGSSGRRHLRATNHGCSRPSTFYFSRASSTMQFLTIGVGWDLMESTGRADKAHVDLDVSAVFLGQDGCEIGAVDYENTEEFGVRHSGDSTTGGGGGDDEEIEVNLDGVPPEVAHIFFVATVFTKGATFSTVKNAFCRILNEDGVELVCHNLEHTKDSARCSALLIAQIFRRPDTGWYFKKRASFLEARTWMDPTCTAEMRELVKQTNQEFDPDPDAATPKTASHGMWRELSYQVPLGASEPDLVAKMQTIFEPRPVPLEVGAPRPLPLGFERPLALQVQEEQRRFVSL